MNNIWMLILSFLTLLTTSVLSDHSDGDGSVLKKDGDQLILYPTYGEPIPINQDDVISYKATNPQVYQVLTLNRKINSRLVCIDGLPCTWLFKSRRYYPTGKVQTYAPQKVEEESELFIISWNMEQEYWAQPDIEITYKSSSGEEQVFTPQTHHTYKGEEEEMNVAIHIDNDNGKANFVLFPLRLNEYYPEVDIRLEKGDELKIKFTFTHSFVYRGNDEFKYVAYDSQSIWYWGAQTMDVTEVNDAIKDDIDGIMVNGVFNRTKRSFESAFQMDESVDGETSVPAILWIALGVIIVSLIGMCLVLLFRFKKWKEMKLVNNADDDGYIGFENDEDDTL